ncbi:glyoxalase [Exiguobacterium aestuarii]|uniref:Glyoxalase n=1 Tax=Exiguobacterium aestuarii TaxID=273527 RepID=A0ABW2PRM3_9BACL|nr:MULTISPECIES: glyoxalase [Exiguobacterium]MCT4784792.1 glyoxalase [Exiguobacterium aestuarii]
MKITETRLYTNRLNEMKRFYTERLGLSVIEEDSTSFRINLGEDALVFQEATTNQERQYHFAINIPANRFKEAKEWIKSRVSLLSEDGEDEIYFEGIDASSLYFYDADENVVELIARHSINVVSDTDVFSTDDFLGIGEMSLTAINPLHVAQELANIEIHRRDGNPIDERHLNFLGAPNSDAYILLVPEGRVWLFSPKLSIQSPIQMTINRQYVIEIDENHELNIHMNKK